ncbi:hypothetical protein NKH18_07135 [Streptomyces sp. M10(2022)]
MLGLMELREARARQELESWTEVLEQAQAEVNAARERVERARVGREELVSALAESTVDPSVSVPSGGEAAAGMGSSGSGRAVASGRRCGGRAWVRRRSAVCTGRCSPRWWGR